MKIIKRIALALIAILVLACICSYFFMNSLKPTYEGSLSLKGLQNDVEVFFDDYGIPHIYADDEVDAQYAMGYLHAQDRLFQMEMIRRLARGEMADILGPDVVQTDRFFRTIGVMESAKDGVADFNSLPDNSLMKKGAMAYHEGINDFIENGPTPIEFMIMGIPKRPFSIEDSYAIFGYMAFSFAQAFRTDPLVMRMQEKLGSDYLKDLDIHWTEGAQTIAVYKSPVVDSTLSDVFDINALFETFPVAPWIGSNSWVIGPEKTKNGAVIFSNDTHIGFSQPSVWYEAYIETPDYKNYGYYLAGVPFPTMGHNDYQALGLTMLENDDIDFYVEKLNPDNPNQVEFQGQWEDLEVREERIKIKGGEDLVFEVKTSRHGPIMNEALEHVSNTTNEPVALWWIYNEFLPKNIEASYKIAHAKSLDEVQNAAALLASPGLNGMYGDKDGNIAWWAMGKLPKRPPHVNSKLFLDGASGMDEILGYYDFSENPHSVNPPTGYVYSANNQPDTTNGVLHAGYYIPEDRAKRIVDILEEDKKWDMEAAKEMINDVQSPIMPQMAKEFVSIIGNDAEISENEAKALEILNGWDGDNQLGDVAPTIYTKLVWEMLKGVFKDELGENDFQTFLETHMIKRTIPFLVKNKNSKWWDNVDTKDEVETRTQIVITAFKNAISSLENQLGNDVDQWTWNKVHVIEHNHPLAQVESLRSIFNVGPIPINGNIEVINNQLFGYNDEGVYTVFGGPAKRRIIDFSDLDNSVNVLPTGQSGNVLSDHYADQAQMFADGEFRPQLTKREEVEKGRRLVLKANN